LDLGASLTEKKRYQNVGMLQFGGIQKHTIIHTPNKARIHCD